KPPRKSRSRWLPDNPDGFLHSLSTSSARLHVANPIVDRRRRALMPQPSYQGQRTHGDERSIELAVDTKHSSLDFVPRVFESSISMASIVESGWRSWRRTQTRFTVIGSMRSSSFLVPDLLMSRVEKMRFSMSLRSRTISEFPVPLNSSKITSSIREPVSTRAVPMMVSEPPSSMLRAAPKKRLGLCSALESTPPERIFPEGGTTAL